jgi:hypothetical protein
MGKDYEGRNGANTWASIAGGQKVIDKVGNSVRAVEKELGVHNAG